MSTNLSRILFPGTIIMQKFRFLPKMLLLIVIMLMPIIMLSYYLHIEITKVTDFAEGERRGVQYVLPLSEILIELTQETSPDFKSQPLNEQIKVIDTIDTKLGAELKTTQTWHELKSLLQEQTSGTRQAAINKTMELIAKVGDNSGLVLDPDIDSYYIMDAAIVKYPNILSKTNQMSFLAIEDLSKPARTVDDQIQIAMLAGAVRSTINDAKAGIQTAVKANPSLEDGVPALTESEVTTVDLIKVVDRVLGALEVRQAKNRALKVS